MKLAYRLRLHPRTFSTPAARQTSTSLTTATKTRGVYSTK